jgi:hypothetical protein
VVMIVTYDPTDYRSAVPDALAEQEAANIVARGVDTVVSNAMVIDCLRVQVVEGHLSKDEVIVQFNGEPLVLNKYANFDKYPNGFCDHSVNIIQELMTTQIRMRRAERSK